ncbi:MAG: flagellar basal body protein [Caulobacteraceae bacterium]|nr:MAG: flagellar basal body protein [Caulobacteraceae bacterium]
MTTNLDAGTRVDALIILTERLTDLISAECRAFEAHRPQEALATIEETSRLANIYRHESQRVRADPSLVSGAAMAKRVALTRATEAFDAVLARHGRALHTAKVVTEGLVKAVADEVASKRVTGAGYGPGAMAAQAPATALTLNRSA